MKRFTQKTSLLAALLSLQAVVTACNDTEIRRAEEEVTASASRSVATESPVSSSLKTLNLNLKHLTVAEQAYGTSNSKNLYAQMSGYKSWGTTTNDLYLFDGKSWTLAGSATVDHLDTTIAFSLDDQTLMIAGGYSDWNGEIKRADLFNIKEKRFERVADLNLPRQENITVTSPEGDFVTIGGKAKSTVYDPNCWCYPQVYYKNFEVYNKETDEWVLYDLNYIRGEEFSAISTPKGIVVIGGRDSTVFNESDVAIGGAVELITKQEDGTYKSKLLPNMKIDRDSPFVQAVTLTSKNANETLGKEGEVILFAFSGYALNMTEQVNLEGLTYEYINLSKVGGDTWHYGSEPLPHDRWDSFGFTMNNEIHMFGGWVSQDGTYKDIVFDIKTGLFSTIDTLGVDGGMGGAGMVVTAAGDSVGVAAMGWGNYNNENSGIAPTIYISNLTGYKWSNAPSDTTLGHSFDGASVRISDTQLLNCGGFLSGELIATNECKIYDSATGLISKTGSMNIAKAEFTLAKNPVNGKIFTVGGTNKWYEKPVVEEYDIVKGVWSERVDMKYGMRRPIVNFDKTGKIYIDGAELWSYSWNTFNLSAGLTSASTPTEPLYSSWNMPYGYIPLTRESGSILYVPDSANEMALMFGLATMLVDTNANSTYWYEGASMPITKYEGTSLALLGNGGVAMFGASKSKNSEYCRAMGMFMLEGSECSATMKIDYPANLLYHTYSSKAHDADTISVVADPEKSSHLPVILPLQNGKILTLGGGTHLDYYKEQAGLKGEGVFMLELLIVNTDQTWNLQATKLAQVYDPSTNKWETQDDQGTDFLYPSVGMFKDSALVYGSYHGIDYSAGNQAMLVTGTLPINQRVRYHGQEGVTIGN